MVMKLQVPLRVVPDGAIVTKVNGSVKFSVKDEVSIKVYEYPKVKGSKPIETNFKTEGCRYLVRLANEGDDMVDISVVPLETVVCMVFETMWDLHEFCSNCVD